MESSDYVIVVAVESSDYVVVVCFCALNQEEAVYTALHCTEWVFLADLLQNHPSFGDCV